MGKHETIRPHTEFIRMKDFQEVFQISKATAYRRVKQGCFNIYKQAPEGRISLVKRSEVEEWLKSSTISLGDQMGDQTAKSVKS